MKISIGIIDDLWPLVYGIKSFLESTGLFIVPITATNGLDFINKINAGEDIPLLMLVDTQMPLMNGPDIVRWIRTNSPKTMCIGLTLSTKPNDRILMMAAGCCGCLNKYDPPELYIKGITEVSRKHFMSGHEEDYINLMLFRSFHDPIFTEEDFILIQAACSDKTNEELAVSLFMSVQKLVRKLSALYLKCDVKNRSGLILKAKELGWAV